MRTAAFLILVFLAGTAPVIAQNHAVDAALQAAPEGERDSATVLGKDASGTWVPLREGDGSLICLADEPDREGFEAVCYHKGLDPYMARGRELKAQGIGAPEHLDIRLKELEEGTLHWPEHPTIMYVLAGDDDAYDEESGSVTGYLRYNVYIPWATTETTGITSEGSGPGGQPWLMNAGTVRAHIMLLPPRDEPGHH